MDYEFIMTSTFIPQYDVKLFTDILNKEQQEYIKQIIHWSTFVPAVVSNKVDTERKIRMDYTLTLRECAQLDDLIEKTGSKCNYRERWRILKYEGDKNSFRSPHIDWHPSTPTRRMSIVIGLTPPSEYTGGELGFISSNKYYKIEPGTAVVFDSSLVHEVKPLTTGIRYVLQAFLLDEPNYLLNRTLSQQSLLHDHKSFNRYGKWLFKKNLYIVSGICVGHYNTLVDVMKYMNNSKHTAFSWGEDGTLYINQLNKEITVHTHTVEMYFGFKYVK